MESNSRIRNPFITTQSPFANYRSNGLQPYQSRVTEIEDKQYHTINNNVAAEKNYKKNANPFEYFQLHGKYDKAAFRSQNKQHHLRNYISPPPISKYQNRLKLQGLDNQYWKKQIEQKQRYKLSHFGVEALRYSNFSTGTPSIDNDYQQKYKLNAYSSTPKLKTAFNGNSFNNNDVSSEYSSNFISNRKNNIFESEQKNFSPIKQQKIERKKVYNDTFNENIDKYDKYDKRLEDSQQLPKFKHGFVPQSQTDRRKHQDNQKLNSIKQSYRENNDFSVTQNNIRANKQRNKSKENFVEYESHYKKDTYDRIMDDSRPIRNFYQTNNDSDPHVYLAIEKQAARNSKTHKKNAYDSFISDSDERHKGPLHFSNLSSDSDAQMQKKYAAQDSVKEINYSGQMSSGFFNRHNKYSSINQPYQQHKPNNYPESITHEGKRFFFINFI